MPAPPKPTLGDPGPEWTSELNAYLDYLTSAIGTGGTGAYVDLSTDQSVDGLKTFLAGISVPDGSITTAKIAALESAIASWAQANNRPAVRFYATGSTPPAATNTLWLEVASTTPSVTALTSGSSGTDAASYATGTITPTVGSVLLASVTAGRTDGTAALPTSLSGLGATWTVIDGQISTAGNIATRLFKGVTPSGTAGTVTMTMPSTMHNATWQVFECRNVSATITNVAKATGATTSASVTLAALTAGSATFGVLAQNGSATVTPGTGYALVGTGVSNTTPSVNATAEFKEAGSTTVDFTLGAANQRNLIAVELKAG